MDKILRAIVLLASVWLCACDARPLAAPALDAPANSALPAQIIRGLNTDEAVLDCFGAATGTPVELQAAWFSSRRLDLDGDGQRDWLVSAADPCLRRAAGVTWIFLARGQAHRLAARIQADVAVESAAGSRGVELVASTNGRALRYRYADDRFTATRALPVVFVGQWRALSKAYADLDPLHIRGESMDMGACTDLTFETLQAGPERVLLALAPASTCRIGSDDLAVVELLEGKKPCQIEVTLYASREAARIEDLFAWGVFERPTCP